MAVVEIVKYPEPVLAKKGKPVTEIDGLLQGQIDDMFDSLYAVSGLGLAAPQVGHSLAIFIYDLSASDQIPDKIKGPAVIMNPEIVEIEGEVIADEGCLSLPGYFEKVKRAVRVQLKGLDREGKDIRIEAEGLFARMLQHEVDHINGVLMVDRFSSLKKDIFLRKFKKKMNRGGMW
ncbi:MAG: peptide deformylase [Nitrospiria bacterium]